MTTNTPAEEGNYKEEDPVLVYFTLRGEEQEAFDEYRLTFQLSPKRDALRRRWIDKQKLMERYWFSMSNEDKERANLTYKFLWLRGT